MGPEVSVFIEHARRVRIARSESGSPGVVCEVEANEVGWRMKFLHRSSRRDHQLELPDLDAASGSAGLIHVRSEFAASKARAATGQPQLSSNVAGRHQEGVCFFVRGKVLLSRKVTKTVTTLVTRPCMRACYGQDLAGPRSTFCQ